MAPRKSAATRSRESREKCRSHQTLSIYSKCRSSKKLFS